MRSFSAVVLAGVVVLSAAARAEDALTPHACPGEEGCDVPTGTKKIVWGSIVGGGGLLVGVLPGVVLMTSSRSSLSKDVAPIGLGVGIAAVGVGTWLLVSGILQRKDWADAHRENASVSIGVDWSAGRVGLTFSRVF